MSLSPALFGTSGTRVERNLSAGYILSRLDRVGSGQDLDPLLRVYTVRRLTADCMHNPSHQLVGCVLFVS